MDRKFQQQRGEAEQDNKSPSQTTTSQPKPPIPPQNSPKVALTGPPPVPPPNSYSTRLATFTSWPHTSPNSLDMAEAGFHHLRDNKFQDSVQCAQCLTSLVRWKSDDDPLIEHMKQSPECRFLCSPSMAEKCNWRVAMKAKSRGSEKPVAMSVCLRPKSPVEGPPKSGMRTATAVKKPASSRRITRPPPEYRPISPPSEPIVKSRSDQQSDSAILTSCVPPNSLEDVSLDIDDWVDLGYEEKEKDDWIEI